MSAQSNFKSAWYCVGFFTILYTLSFVDRYILSLIAEPISKDLGLSDQQIGFLLGAGFAITYSIMGLPAAHLIDTTRRIPIVAAGVMLWSLSTIASAFAVDFTTLAICRAGIAAGEAVLTPAAISLIADLFPREKRATPVSVYSATAGIMGTGALVVGAATLNLASVLAPMTGIEPWRMTMILVGLPGVFLSVLLPLTVREPARVLSEGDGQRNEADLASFLAELRENWRMYLPFYLAIGAAAMYILGFLSWAPTILVRLYGYEASAAGYLLGLIGIPAALASAFFWPWISNRLAAKGREHALLATILISALILAPVFIIAPLAGSAIAVVLGVGFIKLANGSGTLAPLIIQHYGPSQMRGRLMAIYTLSASVVGLTGGASLIPFFASFWPNDPRALIYGVSLLGVIAAVLIILGYWLAGRAAVAKSGTLAKSTMVTEGRPAPSTAGR